MCTDEATVSSEHRGAGGTVLSYSQELRGHSRRSSLYGGFTEERRGIPAVLKMGERGLFSPGITPPETPFPAW